MASVASLHGFHTCCISGMLGIGTATGTASYLGTNAFNGSGSVAAGGGIPLAAGDQFYVVRGTDATAVQTVGSKGWDGFVLARVL